MTRKSSDEENKVVSLDDAKAAKAAKEDAAKTAKSKTEINREKRFERMKQQIIQREEKKLHPRSGSKTASVAENTTARPEEISRAIMNAFQYFNRPLVKSDEECAERINGYFRDCYEQQMLPTVENLSLALGTVRATLWDWEQGRTCSKLRSDMVKKAKQILASIDAELVSSGKIPQVVYIFRSKNFYGMSDQQEIVVNAQQNNEMDMSADEIAKRYLEDGKTVETGFVEEGTGNNGSGE